MALPRLNSCLGCQMVGTGGFTLPEGSGRLGLAAIAEAPGEHEEREGLPLRPYAPAGSVFQRAITRAGIARGDLAIYNVVNCRPPHNDLEGQAWEFAAIQHCRVHRDAFMARFQPRVILAMGNVALKSLTSYSGIGGEKQSITHVRGFPIESRDYVTASGELVWVVPTYHPSLLRRGDNSPKAGKIGGMKLMGVFIADILRAKSIAERGFARQPVEYLTHPRVGEIEQLYLRARENPNLPIAYDIENPTSAETSEDERDDDISMEITSIQFSLGPRTGIFLKWEPELILWARLILSLPNPKLGFNSWIHDDPRLRFNGLGIAGVREDLMWAWHHLQPDLPRGLQFAASLIGGMDFAWKHLSESEPERYGCCDVDALQRMWPLLRQRLESKPGMLRAYERRVRGVWGPLEAMRERGMPVDRQGLEAFKAELIRDEARIVGEIRQNVPLSVLTRQPKEGYKGVPKQFRGEVVGLGDGYAPFEGEPPGVAGPDAQLYFERGKFYWLKPFSPHGAQQVIRLIRANNHKVPRNLDGGNTTEDDELIRLSRATGQGIYPQIVDARRLRKLQTTFVDAWMPGEDGRVHPLFHFGPATGQLASINPSAVIIPKHGPGAARFRQAIQPSNPDHVLVEFDMRSFHAYTLGFEAQSPSYMRAALLDIHSLVSGHILKVHDARRLLEKSDGELREYFDWYKSDPERKAHRDKKSKPTVLGLGFSLGYRKLYNMNRDNFQSEGDAKAVWEVPRQIWPEVFGTGGWQDKIRALANRQNHLLSKWGFIRWFWEVERYDSARARMVPGEDSEAAIAFLPANDAFGIVRECLLTFAERGLDRAWGCGLVDHIHDSFVFEIHRSAVEECIATIQPIMEQAWPELTDPVCAPHGLACRVDVKVGPNLQDMVDAPKYLGEVTRG